MVLVDTSVWVSHLRHGEQRLATLLTNADVMTHGFVIGELACGHLRNRNEILSLLQALPESPVLTQREILSFIETHALYGKGVGVVDVHVLASAILADVPLWTTDKPLQRLAARFKRSYVP